MGCFDFSSHPRMFWLCSSALPWRGNVERLDKCYYSTYSTSIPPPLQLEKGFFKIHVPSQWDDPTQSHTPSFPETFQTCNSIKFQTATLIMKTKESCIDYPSHYINISVFSKLYFRILVWRVKQTHPRCNLRTYSLAKPPLPPYRQFILTFKTPPPPLAAYVLNGRPLSKVDGFTLFRFYLKVKTSDVKVGYKHEKSS